MAKNQVRLVVDSSGLTRIENYSGSQPGIYRVNVGDETLFKFPSNYRLHVCGDNQFTVKESLHVWTVPGPFRLVLVSQSDPSEPVMDDSLFWDPASVIVVNPVAPVGTLRMLTVMPRRLGKISTWAEQLAEIAKNGYNAVHLTPTQTPGPSQSCYSLANLLAVDPALMEEPTCTLRDVVRNSGFFSITDVVLNHASSVDSWVTPACTYCLTECPYLRGAFELDEALSKIEKAEDLKEILIGFKFEDFFKINRDATFCLWRTPRSDLGQTPLSSLEQAVGQIGCCRTGIVLDLREHVSSEDVSEAIMQLESKLAALARECFANALDACRATIHYERVVCGKIGGPLLPRYFSQLSNGDWALNNGWVMNWPAGCDFAAPGHHIVWMKRHVVVWQDCVKLRYGSDLEIWKTMEKYVSETASVFDGVRLDNCHSTPLFVLRRLLRVMRKVRPNIVVVAELFVGDGGNERAYEASLGIDLLVREAMQVHKTPSDWVQTLWGCVNPALILLGEPLLQPQPHSIILYDATHDNSTVMSKFGNFFDALPLAAVVCAAPCATASSVGFDTLATAMPSVVFDKFVPPKRSELSVPSNRSTVWLDGYEECTVSVYGDWDGWKVGTPLIKGRCEIRGLVDKKSEFKFHVFDGIRESWVINSQIGVTGIFRNNLFNTCGTLQQLKRELNLLHARMLGYNFTAKYHQSVLEIKRQNLTTLETYIFLIKTASDRSEGPIEVELDSEFASLELGVELQPLSSVAENLLLFNYEAVVVHWSMSDLGFWKISDHLVSLSRFPVSGVVVLKTKEQLYAEDGPVPVHELLLGRDISYALFCCDAEESCYEVPGYGKLIFAGFAGPYYLIEDTRDFLSSALAANIRAGDWLFDYLANRMENRFPDFGRWMNNLHYRQLPAGLKPARFAQIIHNVYSAIVQKISVSKQNDSLYRSLTVASYQFTAGSTVAAGLPHFAAGYMRCWGRDTFISFYGLFLATGRFQEGKQCLLDFAAVVRHGLVPNLFDDGHNPRYNARDAVWCFLNSVCNYVDVTGDLALLTDSLGTVMTHILRSHWEGIDFIERNAGPQIDEYMRTEGFEVKVYVDRKTGIIHGGNAFNCGTWMDKMGSADSNRGVPATPRCGAAIEINALALRVLTWMIAKQNKEKFISEWQKKLRENFFSNFFKNGQFADVIGSIQLRPNACWALAVVPMEFVDRTSVLNFLKLCEISLVGPLGMRTLSANDPAYNGVYDNNDANRGYNYHNGPEWVWLMGYYLLACRRFAVPEFDFSPILERLEKHIRFSPWRSLPELTNHHGEFCAFSCPSQAWSVCTLLEALTVG